MRLKGRGFEEGWCAFPLDDQETKDLIKNSRHKVVGAKQTLKALEKNEAYRVYLAGDAEDKVTQPIIALCKGKDIEIEKIESMVRLGKLFGIKVKAAAAALLKKA